MRKTKTSGASHHLSGLLSLGLLVSLATFGCSELTLPGPDGGVLVSLIVLPNQPSAITLDNDKVATQRYYACATYSDADYKDGASNKDKGKGTASACPAGTEDVSATTEWKSEPATLGRMDGNLFRTEIERNGKFVPAVNGGKGQIYATYNKLNADASVEVLFRKNWIDKGTPADAHKKFSGKQSGKVTVHYPPPSVLVPPNLGQIEVQFTAPPAAKLYLLEFIGSKAVVRIYTTNKNYTLTLDQWRGLGMTSAGTDVRLRVLATKYTAGVGVSAVSTAQLLRIAEAPVIGGLYYWVVDKHVIGQKPKYGSIYRYDFENPKVKADAYYTYKEAKDCVGCHTVSRGGKYIGFTLSGGNGDGAIFNVEQRTALFDTRKGYKADLHTFNPDGTEVIVVNQGKLTRRETTSGKLLEVIPTGSGMATHPDWGPKGNKLLLVKTAKKDYFAGGFKDDVHFRNGSIYVMERSSGKWGAPKLLVKSTNGVNFYYPSFSPNGDWIVFNRSTGDSYSDEDANVYIVKPNGKGARALGRVNGTKISNSWPRWSPKVEKYKNTTLYWLTFSSVRNYGVRLRNSAVKKYTDKAPQIWMFAFDVNAANKGQDPSQVPFWLPFQDMTHHNHIAQWTQKVVALK